MKALKEKRIRLRSLWRRGLVILSLFALVFASCNSSDAPESETQPTTLPPVKEVNDVNLIKGTLATQYEGLKFNAKGISVAVKYLNGEPKTYEGGTPEFEALFEIKPAYIQGVILADDAGSLLWMPVTEYKVYWKGTSHQIGDSLFPKVIPIQRGLMSGNTSFATFPISGQFSIPAGTNSAVSSGVLDSYPITAYVLPKELLGTQSGYVTNSTFNFVGDLELLNNGVRVDDPALATIKTGEKFRLQATYTDLTVQEIPIKENPNVEARFITFYNAGARDDASGTAAGELLLALANAPSSYADAAIKAVGTSSFTLNGVPYNPKFAISPINSTRQGKLTAMHYIPKVYNVDKIEISGPTADLDKDTGLYLKYWEIDDGASWLTKSALTNADVKITYTGARPGEEISQTRKLSTLLGAGGGIVWESPNSFDGGEGTDGDYSPWRTLGVSNVRDTAQLALDQKRIKSVAWDKLPAQVDAWTGTAGLFPAIRVNYRGAIDFVPVDIVNLVDSFQVNWKEDSKYKPGGEIGYLDMRWERGGESRKENDIATGAGGGAPSWDEATWGGQLEGTVQYHSVRGNALPEQPVTLKATPADSQPDSVLGAPSFVSNFTSNYGPISGSPAWSPTTGTGPMRDWTFNEAGWGTAGFKKNGSRAGTDKNISLFYAPPKPSVTNTAITGKITEKLQKQTVPVRFRGIGIMEEYRTPFKD